MRTREIDREFWLSYNVATLSYFERLLFIALWAAADREGLVLNRPDRLKAEAFPLDMLTSMADIEKGVAALAHAGLIQILSALDGNVITCIYIPNFLKFQNIHPNEMKSKLKCNYIPCNVIQCPSHPSIPSQPSRPSNPSDKESPPTPRKRGRTPAKEVSPAVKEIVEHLNAVTGKSYAVDRSTSEIERAIRAGASTEDCKRVIDHCWKRWKDDPKMVGFVNKVTPFRAKNFDAYLDEALAGPAFMAMTTAQKEQAAKDQWFNEYMKDLDDRAAAKAKGEQGNGTGHGNEEPEDRNVMAKITGIARWT